MAYSSFEDLDVWKNATGFAVRMYEILKECSDYGLKDQITRAAVSIASNIAEGAERDSKAEYIRFLHIAKGSSAELRTQIHIACKIGVIDPTLDSTLISELTMLSKQMQSLVKYLTTKLPSNLKHKS